MSMNEMKTCMTISPSETLDETDGRCLRMPGQKLRPIEWMTSQQALMRSAVNGQCGSDVMMRRVLA